MSFAFLARFALLWATMMAGASLARAEFAPSPTLMGALGLNTVPSARMDKAGTARASVSTLDPYTHAALGFQFTDGIYISLRQSVESSSLRGDADALHPGIDVKLRLAREGPYTPEIAVGLQSALGNQRMAGEYITFSKRYKNFDFTAGLGWGRYGQGNNIKNPLKPIQHFDQNRDGNDVDYNNPENWFSGDSIGFFGGAEYALPIENLTLKVDYTSDHFEAEKKATDFDAPSPWGIGISYSPKPWINAGIGLQGTDKVMARLSFQSGIEQWQLRRSRGPPDAQETAQRLMNIRYNDNKIGGNLLLPSAGASAPAAIGQAARALEAEASDFAAGIEIRPYMLSLRGPRVTLSRVDVDKSGGKDGISPEELWKNAEFSVASDDAFREKDPRILKGEAFINAFYLTLENQVSFAERETGVLYRTSLLAHAQTSPFLGYFSLGGAIRLNLGDNLDLIHETRPAPLYAIRSDLNNFTKERISVDNLHLSYARSLTPEWHTLLTTGYVDEQYAGTGAEVLYRPFSSRFALGMDGWMVSKRNPQTIANLGLDAQTDSSLLVNAWYDFPKTDITLSASAGQFLGSDRGGSLGLEKVFDNGTSLSGFVTVTNARDIDTTGEPLQTYHGIQLRVPLGGIPYLPDGSNFNTEIGPLLRDAGQRVRAPLQLYELTENFTIDHLAKNWRDILSP